ncbi:NAD-dependent protein deacetylase [Hylemonella sp. W303a]|uniref:NAD-dependent protein deacetylase n=1 Tax=Hylemonella sp. W303a TaxID=3389873 RepID=UPI00396B065C
MADIDTLVDFAARYPRLFVLTGAGVSTDSGIPDYRDANGDWKRPPPVTFQAFMGELATRQRYWARSLIGWRTIGQARPGPAHHALAVLEAAGRIELLLTQNVDGLHQAAGSRQVIDLHGRIDTVCCMACARRWPRAEWQETLRQANPDWVALHAPAAPDGDADLDGVDFSTVVVPPCPHCTAEGRVSIVKPDVVFFGENAPRARVQAAFDALARSDAMLVVGSSLMVYSGLRFVQAAVAAGQPVAALNLGRTRADDLFALKVEQSVGPALRALAVAYGPRAASSV